MMAMANESNLTRLVADLGRDLATDLRSVILYGSAARGDPSGSSSDLNLLIVVADDSPGKLVRVSKTAREWVKAGNPPLLFVTAEWIRRSTDVFPIEFLDMLDHRRVCFGDDPLAGVTVSTANLRLQCEREIRSILLKLRASWLQSHDDSGKLFEILASSFGPATAIARAALRLAGERAPAQAGETFQAAARVFGIDAAPLLEAAAVKREGGARDLPRMTRVFLGWFAQIEALGRALDASSGVAADPGSTKPLH